ncbi:hypothetical protein OF83DRAFT_1080923 [Amylostereum chailletii]|nr:hypothetical protein OF83DRAFT_1080923 [Amylostereum chailletii]
MAIPPQRGRTLPHPHPPPSSDSASQSSSRRSSIDQGEHSPPPPPPSASSSPAGRVRERRHACPMCYKAFDRPSTLNKHLLVHTGEKRMFFPPSRSPALILLILAYTCEICGHRFGVASNLNRHARKCRLRPVNSRGLPASSSNAASSSDASSEPGPSDSTSPAPTLREERSESPETPGPKRGPAHGRTSISTVEAAAGATVGTTRKRRSRRAPSPVIWVPNSLSRFAIGSVKKACQMPLEPVLPFHDDKCWEERDSYEEQPSELPYHPDGWRGRLPGPGLRDIMNTTLGTGRLVFL